MFSTYWAVHVDQKGLGGSQEFTGWRKWYKIQSDDLPATIFKYELGKQNQMQQSLDVAVACTVTRLCKVLQNSEDPINISPRSQAHGKYRQEGKNYEVRAWELDDKRQTPELQVCTGAIWRCDLLQVQPR